MILRLRTDNEQRNGAEITKYRYYKLLILLYVAPFSFRVMSVPAALAPVVKSLRSFAKKELRTKVFHRPLDEQNFSWTKSLIQDPIKCF